MNCIYLDHNATTPVDPRVKQAMLPYLEQDFGNPSSQSHAYGWKAQMAVEKARSQVGKLLGAPAKSVVWTAGATESNNLAILGLLDFLLDEGERPHFITDAVEHKAVLEVFERAKKRGAEISIVPVNSEGAVELRELEKHLRPNTRLISVMAANNEIGTVNSIAAIAELCRSKKIVFHCDAAQGVGRVPLCLEEQPIDLLSMSGHKLYAPKGIGTLIVRPINRAFELRPVIVGGEQERGLRAGTLNVASIVGIGLACEILQSEMSADIETQRAWQRKFIGAIADRSGVVLNGPRENRLCNNLSFSFERLHPDEILEGLQGFAVSSGSACTSGNPKPSHVLKAIGRSDSLAKATVRLGFGRFNTNEEINHVLERLIHLTQ